jgi:succinyl-CoA synthetase beta subunit
MTERDLKKLNRTDLLELLLQQSREMEQLQDELAQVKHQLSRRTIVLNEAGSIAEAALQLNGVFAAAENACAQYIESIQHLSGQQEEVCQQMLQETQAKCDKMMADAKYQSEIYWDAVNKKVEKLLDSQRGLRELLQPRGK